MKIQNTIYNLKYFYIGNNLLVINLNMHKKVINLNNVNDFGDFMCNSIFSLFTCHVPAKVNN